LISYISFNQILLITLGFRSRILTYILRIYIFNIILAPLNIDSNLLVLLVAEGSNILELINIYNKTS
jgi:hypothetical protein